MRSDSNAPKGSLFKGVWAPSKSLMGPNSPCWVSMGLGRLPLPRLLNPR